MPFNTEKAILSLLLMVERQKTEAVIEKRKTATNKPILSAKQKTEAIIQNNETITNTPILSAFNSVPKRSKNENEINAKMLVQEYWNGLIKKTSLDKPTEDQLKAIATYDAIHKTNYSIILNGLMHHTDDKSRVRLQQWVMKEYSTSPDTATKPANNGNR